MSFTLGRRFRFLFRIPVGGLRSSGDSVWHFEVAE